MMSCSSPIKIPYIQACMTKSPNTCKSHYSNNLVMYSTCTILMTSLYCPSHMTYSLLFGNQNFTKAKVKNTKSHALMMSVSRLCNLQKKLRSLCPCRMYVEATSCLPAELYLQCRCTVIIENMYSQTYFYIFHISNEALHTLAKLRSENIYVLYCQSYSFRMTSGSSFYQLPEDSL